MSIIIRIYCQSDEPPPLQDIMDWINEDNLTVTLDEDTLEGDLESSDWLSADLLIVESEASIQLDCVRGEGDTVTEFEKQCNMFETEFNELEEVGEANPVRDHLAMTNYFVRLQVPSDTDSATQEVIEIIQQTLASNEAGIVHVEGKGFYDADGELLMDLEGI